MPKITFHSPGTFVHETTTIETDLTDPNLIKDLAAGIVERHGAKPFGFTIEGDDHFYWVGQSKLLSYDEIPDTVENSILRRNMRVNQITHVIENRNSWRMTSEYRPDRDVLLDA